MKTPGTKSAHVFGSIRDWLGRQTDSWVGRLSFMWFNRYMRASKNCGAATSAYFMLSVIPTALVAIALVGESGGNTNALAERLITHMQLSGSAADIVRQTFGTTASNAVAATVAVVISFPLCGIGIGQLYLARLHASVEGGNRRQWASDQVLFTIWALCHLRPDRAPGRGDDGDRIVQLAALHPRLARRIDSLMALH